MDSESKSDEDDPDVGSMEEQTRIKWEFRDQTWKNPNFEYNPKPRVFHGNRMEPSRNYHVFRTFLTLFELFWTPQILQDIVQETNRYAMLRRDEQGNTRGGPNWGPLIVAGLKAFMALALYMGLKPQPNYKTYWLRNSFFHCNVVRRYLHLRRSENIRTGEPGYDRMFQTQRLLDQIRGQCQMAWCIGKNLTIDEMMIRYKSTYSPIC